jgi:hypothetical protein
MDKMLALEQKIREEKISVSKLLNNIGHEYCALYGRLATDWLHSEGFVKRILDHTLAKSDIPAYALASPMSYNETDIGTINDLGSSISKFGTLLRETTDRWQKELSGKKEG